MEGGEYRIALEGFHGPLDLLLYLIKSQEIDIHDIPIARIADQYLSYLDTLSLLDINVAVEFLVLAATLLEIKSRMLLPREPGPTDDLEAAVEDPRSDLVRKLLEYKLFRDLADNLETLRMETEARFDRGAAYLVEPRKLDEAERPFSLDDDEDEGGTVEASLWDLLSALQRILREAAADAPRTIVYDETPISVHLERLLELMRRHVALSFVDLFEGRRDRGFVIGTFLALLELCRLSAVTVEDVQGSGDLMVRITERGQTMSVAQLLEIEEAQAARETSTQAEAPAEAASPAASVVFDDEEPEEVWEIADLEAELGLSAPPTGGRAPVTRAPPPAREPDAVDDFE